MMNDPTQDMPGECCAKCRFAKRGEGGLSCLRNPPHFWGVMIPKVHPITQKVGPEWETASGWPGVNDNQWCGEFAVRHAMVLS